MKPQNIIIVLALIVASTYSNFAQDNTATALKTGDQVPEIEFLTVLNSDKKSFKLSDFKGKLVILDFFATWCSPCIEALPKMDSLQKQFKDQLVILPITSERENTMNDFLKKRPEFKMSLPYVYKTNLKHFFPYRLIPHEVWIDPTGKLIAQTDAKQVTADNIKKILANPQTSLAKKNDVTDVDYLRPFLAGLFGSYKFQPDQLLQNSTLIKGFEGVASMMQSMPYHKNGQSYIRSTNQYVHKLYQTALLDVLMPAIPWTTPTPERFYKEKEFYKKMMARVIWEASDSTLFYGKENELKMRDLPWEKYLFHYELVMPETDDRTFKKIMLEDLNRYFATRGLNGTLEKRKVKCYALQFIADPNALKSKGGTKKAIFTRGVKGFEIQNLRIDDFMFWWISNLDYLFPTPIINETNYEEPIDLNLGQIDHENFEEFNTALQKVGMQFKLVERDLDMIVIRNAKK